MSERRAKGSVYAEKFRIMLRAIPHPDGGSWGGTKMERATGGKVSTSYFSALRDGHIEVPRADKIEAIAGAMGFGPGLWFKDLQWWQEVEQGWEQGRGVEVVFTRERRRGDGERLSRLLNRLFETKADEETGEPFTNAKVARESGGELTEEDVEALRAGRLANPSWAQILALCDVFDVDAAYWSEHDTPPWRPSPATLKAAEGADSYIIFQNSLKLSDKNRSVLKMLAEHLRHEQEGRDRS
jgi:hypothetical protein